jgi:hypothetical protein
LLPLLFLPNSLLASQTKANGLILKAIAWKLLKMGTSRESLMVGVVG